MQQKPRKKEAHRQVVTRITSGYLYFNSTDLEQRTPSQVFETISAANQECTTHTFKSLKENSLFTRIP